MHRPDAADDGLTEAFTAARARLAGLAYRITGSRIEAEDIVQDAWLRAQRADWDTVDRPDAWFTTVVSRLALDHLRSAAHRRERYVGPWLPEPVRTVVLPGRPDDQDPAILSELAESITFGFLRLMEALSPVERVVFLLAEVYEVPYRDIAPVVERTPEHCRLIATRARRHVRDGRVRNDVGTDAAPVVRELLRAVQRGDVDRVVQLLAGDAELVSDGGPDTHAARRPVRGAGRVARLLVNLSRRYAPRSEMVDINGDPGLISWRDDKLFWALAFDVRDGTVTSIHAIRSPAKLAALQISSPIL